MGVLYYVGAHRPELYHHGVEDQKWGVRRYQNPDGSYKPGVEGRYYDKKEKKEYKKYLKNEIKSLKKEYGKDAYKLSKIIGKSKKDLTDDEIEKMKKDYVLKTEAKMKGDDAIRWFRQNFVLSNYGSIQASIFAMGEKSNAAKKYISINKLKDMKISEIKKYSDNFKEMAALKRGDYDKKIN